MKLIGNRISFNDSKEKFTVVIEPEKNGFVNSLMGAWLSMWLTIGVIVIWSLATLNLKEQEQIILYVFLVFWFYYAFRVTRSFLWLLFGKELIKIDEVSLTIKKSIKNYGQSIPYYFENIKNLKFEVPEKNSIQVVWESSPWINGGERLNFEYFDKVVRFGRKLNEKEAQLLFNVIAKQLKERSKK
ncbi:MAG: hypothetical protein FGM14_06685 [Flavobacteriales bacterium]|nr:hypothetical protein [Flavobacteriales bacterium]